MSAKETSVTDLAERWRRAQAPRTGDIRLELSMEAAEFLGEPLSEVQRRVDESAAAFPAEWNRLVTDPSSPEQLTRFYNESTTELYEQIAWHAGDAIHTRSLACSGLASTRPGRDFLDFGSGSERQELNFELAKDLGRTPPYTLKGCIIASASRAKARKLHNLMAI